MSQVLIPVVGTGPIEVTALHGFTQTGGVWEEIAQLSGLGAVVPDLPGHGSAWPADTTWRGALDAVATVLGPKPTTLVGYSQGGRVALGVALDRPGSIRHLVLISASAGLSDPEARAERRRSDERLADEIGALGAERFIDQWLAQPMFDSLRKLRSEEWQARDRLRRLVSDPAGLAAALRGYGLGAMPDLTDRLGALAMPVTILAGERDERYVDHAVTLAEHIPHADLRIAPGVGHAVPAEAPELVAAVWRETVD